MIAVSVDGTAVQIGNGSQQTNHFLQTTPGTRVDIGSDGITYIDTEVAADALRKLELIWAKLTKDNVACSCCSSDAEYQTRVNEIGSIIGKPRWNGLRTSPEPSSGATCPDNLSQRTGIRRRNMFAQVIHDLVDLVQGLDPNKRAELHERIGEESAAAANAAAPPEEPPPAAPLAAVPDLPPETPPAAA